MLAPHTQKAISKVLTVFGRADPFEAKLVILAKAYSIVRGCREKKDAPLDEFFDICALDEVSCDQQVGGFSLA